MKFQGSMHMFKKTLILLSCVYLTACLEEKQDLNDFYTEVHATQQPDIEPIPVMKPYQKFDYAAADLRDPFTVTVVDLNVNEHGSNSNLGGLQPDKHRRKEALEAYPLSELQYVGTLEKKGIWGLVRASDGIINRVQVGNYIGQNHGRILSVTSSEIRLKEIVSNGSGGYVERDSSLPIVEVN